jgi:Na+/glutamate symporter
VKVGLAAALVGLVFLVLAGVLLRRYVTESDEEEEDLETAEVAIE